MILYASPRAAASNLAEREEPRGRAAPEKYSCRLVLVLVLVSVSVLVLVLVLVLVSQVSTVNTHSPDYHILGFDKYQDFLYYTINWY